MANITDEKTNKSGNELDQTKQIERALVGQDGTISIPNSAANLKSVDVADVDLLLSFSDNTYVVIPNGALDAISGKPLSVNLTDTKIPLENLFKKVGLSKQLQGGSLRVASENVDILKTKDDVDVPDKDIKDTVNTLDEQTAEIIAAPAPISKSSISKALQPTNSSGTHTTDASDPVMQPLTPRETVYKDGQKTENAVDPTITIAKITTDGIIDSAEAQQNISITGKVTGFKPGDTVIVSVNGVDSTGIVRTDLTFSIDVKGSDLVADSDNTVFASVFDVSGKSASDTESYTVNINPSITLEPNITSDDIINLSESQTDIAIRGTVNDIKTGTFITLTVNGVDYTGQVASDSTFSINVKGSDLASDPDKTILATVTDSAGVPIIINPTGNPTADTENYGVDIVAPSAPTVALTRDSGISGSDRVTNVGTLAVTGIEAGSTTQYSIDGGTTWANNFTAVEGANTVEVRQIDLAGNTSAATPLSFVLDTIPPTPPTITLLNDSGKNPTDRITNDATLNITGLEPGATVEYSIDGGTTWTNSFTAAEGTNIVLVRQYDLAGNTSVGNLSFTLDTVITNPTIALVTDSGSNNTDKITNVGTLAITGLEAGATVEYSTDGGATWSNTFAAAEGSNSVIVRQTDVAGNVGTNSLTFTLDTTSPLPPGLSLVSDSGSSGTDFITRIGGINVTGIEPGATVEYSIDGGGTWTPGFTAVEGPNNLAVRQTDIAGNTSSASSISFTLDTAIATPTVTLANDTGSNTTDTITKDGALIFSAQAEPGVREYSVNGSAWSTSFTTPTADGSYTVSVRDTDLAGNTATGALSYTLDTTPPLPPTVGLINDSGSNATDGTTNNGSLNVTGLETSATVEYSIDGGTTWTNSFTAVEGSNTVDVRQVDLAGNASPPTPFTFILDTTAPNPLAVTLLNDTGSSLTDTITKDGTLDVTGMEPGATVQYSVDGGTTWTNSFTAVQGSNSVDVRQTDAAGNSSTSTNLSFTLDTIAPVKPIVTSMTPDTGVPNDHITSATQLFFNGTAEANSTVEVFVNGIGKGTAPTDALGNWSFDYTGTTLSVGSVYTITATAQDAAGNTGSASDPYSFSIDATPPMPSITLNPSITSDNVINSGESLGTVAITGTVGGDAQAGDKITITVNGKDYTGLVQPDGTTFSINVAGADLATAPDATVHASIISYIGTISGGASDTAVYTVDTTAPAAPAFALNSDTGSVGDSVTSNGTVDVALAGDAVSWRYSTNGGISWNDGVGTSFTLPEGTYAIGSIQVEQTDSAGNVSSPVNNTAAITVDITPPALSVPFVSLQNDTGSSNTDKITNDGTLTVSVTDLGATIEYSIDGGTTWNGTFTATEGANSVDVRATDLAGNTATAQYSFILDTTLAAPTFALTSDTGANNSDGITNNGLVNVTLAADVASWQYTTDGGTTWNPGTGTTFTLAEGIYAVGDIQVQQTDSAGNTTLIPATNTSSITVDTTAPAAPVITIDNITADNTINSAEAIGGVTVTGNVTGAKAGDTITLTLENSTNTISTYSGTILANGSFSIEVAGSSLTSDSDLTIAASLTTSDLAGNSTTSNAIKVFSTSTSHFPLPSINLDPNITVDDIINIAEASSTIAITGTVGGDAQPNDIVTITINTHSYTRLVQADKTFSIDVSGADLAADSHREVVASVTTYDAAHNPGTATDIETYTVDITRPTAAITITDAVSPLDPLKIGDTANVTITFSEAVSGFDNSDLIIANGSLTAVSSGDGGKTWTAVFTPTAGIEDNTNIITLKNGSVSDLAGNANSGTYDSSNYVIDTLAPSVTSITMSDTNLKIGETSTLTITFNEAVTNFSNANINLTNANCATLTPLSSIDGGKTWTAIFTPTSGITDLTNTIAVNGTYTDLAGNTGTGQTSGNYTIDTQTPGFICTLFTSPQFKIDLNGAHLPGVPVGSHDATPAGQATHEIINGTAGSDLITHNSAFSASATQWSKTLHIGFSNFDTISSVELIANPSITGFDFTGTGAAGITVAMDHQDAAGKHWIVTPATNTTLIGGLDLNIVYDVAVMPAPVDFSTLVNVSGTAGILPFTINSTLDFSWHEASTALDFTGPKLVLPSSGVGTDINAGAGNDTVYAGAGNDLIYGGDGNDTLIGGAGADALYGGDIGTDTGNDTASYLNDTTGVTASLAPGFTGVGGEAQGDTYFGIENLTGGSRNDTLTGDGGVNILSGNAGNDTLYGMAGNDILYGGDGNDILIGGAGADNIYGGDTLTDTGNDTVSYAGSTTLIIASLLSGSGTNGDAAGDTYHGVENIIGGDYFGGDTLTGNNGDNTIDGRAGNDWLDGGAGNDTLYGGSGDDTLLGGTGADTLYGGDSISDSGTDTVSYINDTTGVTASLTSNTGVGGEAQGDTYSGIENLTGGSGNDTLTGDGSNNTLSGGNGDDTLYGMAGNDTLYGGDGTNILIGGAGADYLVGGNGIDTVSYVTSTTNVTVSLASRTGSEGDALGDSFSYNSIENLTGGSGNDHLYGDSRDNVIMGGNGDDILYGDAGTNYLYGGNNVSDTGNDTVDYSALTISGVIASLTTGIGNGGGATDHFYGIENLTGGQLADTLTGDSGINILHGMKGNDTLYGMDGNDILYGDDGDDILYGGLGADSINGGIGNDSASYLNSALKVTVSLDPGRYGEQTNEASGDTFSLVENLIGSNFDDHLIGDTGNNTLTGGLGADFLEGGDGTDTASYASATGTVTVSLTTGLVGVTQSGDAAGDTFNSIENVVGSDFNDTLIGSIGINALYGGKLNDILEGLGGASDLLDGGSGIDTASYTHAGTDVVASLTTTFSIGPAVTQSGDAAGDTFVAIENLTGGAFNDTLIGDSGQNTLDGGGGNNIFEGMAGADTFIGGTGIDTVSYAHATAAVKMDLSSSGSIIQIGDTATLNDAIEIDAGGHVTALDTFTSIENIIGSNNDDRLGGNAIDNIIDGGSGDDTIYGFEGNDTLTGGLGNDTMYGSSGDDIIYANLGRDTASGGDGNDTFYVSSSPANLPNLIDGGARTGGDGNTLVLQDLVNGGSYDMNTLAGDTNRLVNIDTLNIRGNGVGTTLTISAQDVLNMVDNGSGSQLTIKADAVIDHIVISGVADAPTVINPNQTDYTVYTDLAHTQSAVIHWQTA